MCSSNPKTEKHVKQAIVDKEAQKEVLAILKSYKKEVKAFGKVNKKLNKQFEELASDPNSTDTQLNEPLDA